MDRPHSPAGSSVARVVAGRGIGGAHADVVVDFRRDRGNVAFDLPALARSLDAPLSARHLDWLELAAAVFLTDIALPRGPHNKWNRAWTLEVEVREPDVWNAQAGLLTETLRDLSGDRIELAFRAAGAPAPSAARPARRRRRTALDGIALLSGGLDSFAGAIDLLDRGHDPLFLSHRTGNTTVVNSQRAAHRRLERHAGRAIPWAPVAIRARTGRETPFPPDEEREDSQRLRSFLFLSLACVAASALEVERIWIHENGILTYPLPLTAARLGSRSTRSTHPQLLQQMAALSRGILDWQVRLANPFHLKTKQEVVARIQRAGCADAVPDLVSCWRIGRIPRPCGLCLPCLLRQLAVAGNPVPDAPSERDLLSEGRAGSDRDAAENRRTAGELLRLIGAILRSDDAALVSEWPEAFVPARLGVRTTQILRLYRRFAAQSLAALRAHYPASAALLGTVAIP